MCSWQQLLYMTDYHLHLVNDHLFEQERGTVFFGAVVLVIFLLRGCVCLFYLKLGLFAYRMWKNSFVFASENSTLHHYLGLVHLNYSYYCISLINWHVCWPSWRLGVNHEMLYVPFNLHNVSSKLLRLEMNILYRTVWCHLLMRPNITKAH